MGLFRQSLSLSLEAATGEISCVGATHNSPTSVQPPRVTRSAHENRRVFCLCGPTARRLQLMQEEFSCTSGAVKVRHVDCAQWLSSRWPTSAQPCGQHTQHSSSAQMLTCPRYKLKQWTGHVACMYKGQGFKDRWELAPRSPTMGKCAWTRKTSAPSNRAGLARIEADAETRPSAGV